MHYAAFTDEQKLKYENDMINELDKQYAISENYTKGFAEGEARGETRGRQEGLKEGESRGEARGRRESVLELAITCLQTSEIENL